MLMSGRDYRCLLGSDPATGKMVKEIEEEEGNGGCKTCWALHHHEDWKQMGTTIWETG